METKIPQQLLLRQTMQRLGLTRKQFSDRLGIKPRRLDSWLLPDGSPELRRMDRSARTVVERLLRREDLIDDSKLVVVDQSSDMPQVCCPHGVRFPSIYRLTGYGLRLREDGKTIDPGAIGELLPPEYVMDPAREVPRYVARAERIIRLDPAVDSGWLIIRQHRNLDAMVGYIDAVVDKTNDVFGEPFESVGVETQNGIFTLLHRPARPGTPDCLIIYATMCQPAPGSVAAKLSHYGDGFPRLVDCITVISSTGEQIDPDLIWPQEAD